MKLFHERFQGILRDKIALQLFLLAAAVCVLNVALSWFLGSLLIISTLICSIIISTVALQNAEAKRKVQSFVTSILAVKLDNWENKPKPPDDDTVEPELDAAIESFFMRIIRNFISSWYSTVTQDEMFVWNIKVEVSQAMQRLAIRLRNVDYPVLLSNRLLPAVYNHFDILDRTFQAENLSEDQLIKSFIESENQVHRAALNRNSEINYLRQVSMSILPQLLSRSNYDCQVLLHLVREILTCSVLLPLFDVISDPATINSLVILATSAKAPKVNAKNSCEKRVVLLENFTKHFEMSLSSGDNSRDQKIDRNFFRDQEKLYSFMQHLKSKNNTDIELLKFYLDVEHLNSELEKSNVICDPVKLSELQQKSEKLLLFYNSYLCQSEQKPNDLLEAHDQAKANLEAKWRNDFYKSSDYYQLIYGDKENSNIPEATKAFDSPISHQKLSSKLKSAMSIRTGTVEGLEALEIPIWDALDHPLGHTSYYNSMAVKLRKERGQDLDNFMQAFFHSIEQEADLGEDIASTQTKEEEKFRRQKHPSHLGNVELYKNLFNITGHKQINECSTSTSLKTPSESAMYFLSSILNLHETLLRIFNFFLRFLPDANSIICKLIRNFLHKNINQNILAKLVRELEEKVFDPKPPANPSKEELLTRKNLATTRIENVHKNLGKTVSYLQYPVINKHLMYCLVDIIIVEIFPELNLHAKD